MLLEIAEDAQLEKIFIDKLNETFRKPLMDKSKPCSMCASLQHSPDNNY